MTGKFHFIDPICLSTLCNSSFVQCIAQLAPIGSSHNWNNGAISPFVHSAQYILDHYKSSTQRAASTPWTGFHSLNRGVSLASHNDTIDGDSDANKHDDAADHRDHSDLSGREAVVFVAAGSRRCVWHDSRRHQGPSIPTGGGCRRGRGGCTGGGGAGGSIGGLAATARGRCRGRHVDRRVVAGRRTSDGGVGLNGAHVGVLRHD